MGRGLRLEHDADDELREAAAERRSLSDHMAADALERVREVLFVDANEMAEILSDAALVRRLREGSRQARQREGDFVA